MKNAKESFSSPNERMLISNLKTYEDIKLTCKDKYTVKFRILEYYNGGV